MVVEAATKIHLQSHIRFNSWSPTCSKLDIPKTTKGKGVSGSQGRRTEEKEYDRPECGPVDRG